MRAIIQRKTEEKLVRTSEEVLVRGAEVVCPELSPSRMVIERIAASDFLLVMRMARIPAKPKAIPAHFLVLEFSVYDGCVFVETDPVMTLPGKKNGFVRDSATVVNQEAV